MMNRKLRHGFAILIVLALIFSLLPAGTRPVSAARKISINLVKKTIQKSKKTSIVLKNLPKGAKIRVRTSKPKKVSLAKNTLKSKKTYTAKKGGTKKIYVYAKAKGTTKISVIVKSRWGYQLARKVLSLKVKNISAKEVNINLPTPNTNGGESAAPVTTITPTPTDTPTLLPTEVIKETPAPTVTPSPTPTSTPALTPVPTSVIIPNPIIYVPSIPVATLQPTAIEATPQPPTIKGTYTITFDSNGGSTITEQKIDEGQTAGKPDDPVKNGYLFLGWYSDAALDTSYDFSTEVHTNITLYAKWEEIKTYTVKFDSNGGTSVPDQTITSDRGAIEPSNPTKAGYLFDGWYTENDDKGEKWVFSTRITSDITLYAHWKEDNTTISLTADTMNPYAGSRKITGKITLGSGNGLRSISYTVKGAHHTVNGKITPVSTDFEIPVLLENGENNFTVTIETLAGSKSATLENLNYDGTKEYDINIADFEPITEPNRLYEGYAKNILVLFFKNGVSFEEKENYVNEILGGTVIGYQNTIDMIQVQLPENTLPIGDAASFAIASATEEQMVAYANAVKENSTLLDSVFVEYLVGNDREITQSINTNDTWGGISGSTTDDALEGNAWWIKRIQANDAWDYAHYHNLDYFNPIHLGVADNGFDIDHPDLQNGQLDILNPDFADAEDHGTHVSGIIAATTDNEQGLAGIMYNKAVIEANDAFPNHGQGTYTSILLEKLTETVEAGAKVVNYSVGSSGSIPRGTYSRRDQDIADAGRQASEYIGRLLGRGYDFIVVQSAGNGNKDGIGVDYQNNGTFCCINEDNCYSQEESEDQKAVTKQDIMNRVMVVAALSQDGEHLTSFSNGGTGELKIVAAPGHYIYSAVTNGQYALFSGTSMAAPIVTAVCGQVWSVNPELSGDEVADIVYNNCDGTAGQNEYNTHTSGGMGIVNSLQAVEAAVDSLPTYRMRIMDSVDDTILPENVVLKIYNGGLQVGNEEGYAVNDDGYVVLPKLPQGSYQLKVSADGYLNTNVTIEIENGESRTITLYPIVMTKELNGGQYRITLAWKDRPRDLDSHLVAETLDGNYYHVYYHRKNPSPAYANLDHDDVDGNGYETVTITNFEDLRNIKYSVHDYSNRRSGDSSEMSNLSQAVVTVWKGERDIATFEIPVGIACTEWDVFEFDSAGNVIPTNRFLFCRTPELVGGPEPDIPVNSTESVNESEED